MLGNLHGHFSLGIGDSLVSISFALGIDKKDQNAMVKVRTMNGRN